MNHQNGLLFLVNHQKTCHFNLTNWTTCNGWYFFRFCKRTFLGLIPLLRGHSADAFWAGTRCQSHFRSGFCWCSDESNGVKKWLSCGYVYYPVTYFYFPKMSLIWYIVYINVSIFLEIYVYMYMYRFVHVYCIWCAGWRRLKMEVNATIGWSLRHRTLF